MALTETDGTKPGLAANEGSSDRQDSPAVPSETRPLNDRVRRRWFLIVGTMAWFPVLYMSPVLGPGTRLHLRSPRAEPDLLTDMDGAIWLARALRSMPLPWSESVVTAVPTGESIWRWQAVTQALQVVSLWGLTRVLEPTLAVNTFVLLGWIVTGVAGYVLARSLGADTVTALSAGVLCQMLPSMPTMASNYTSYVYVGVPLLVLAAVIRVMTEPSWRRVATLAASLALTAFFDPYWLFFALAMVLAAAATNARTIQSWRREQPPVAQVLLLLSLALPVVLVGGVVAIDRRVRTGSRPLEVADTNLIKAGLRSPVDWFQWSYGGVGILIPILAVAYAVIICSRRDDRRLITAVVVGVMFTVLSTRTTLSLGVFEIGSLAEYARFGMPGVRFFQRAALIAEAVLCVLAVLAVRDLSRRADSGFARKLIGATAFVLLVVTLAPWHGRAVFRPAPAFAAVREILAEVDHAVVATVPADRVGRSWFELSLLDVASVNGLSDLEGAQTVERAASQGAGALAAHLASKGVTHLLAVDGTAGLPLSFALEPPRFISRMTFPVSGFELAPMTVTVYEVHAQDGDRFCETCSRIRQTYLNGGNYPLEELSPGNTAWWMFGPSSALSVQTYPGAPFKGILRLRLGNTPCRDPRTVEVRSGPITRDVTILSGQDSAEIDFPIDDLTIEQPLEFHVQGDTCRIDGDSRDFSLQIFQPQLVVDE